jgi:hypothetical protein
MALLLLLQLPCKRNQVSLSLCIFVLQALQLVPQLPLLLPVGSMLQLSSC